MFSKTVLSAALAAMLAGAAGAADAPAAPAATLAALTPLYALTCTAALDPTDKNIDASFAVLAPEYVAVDPKGKELKRDEIVGTMKQQLKLYHSTECKNDIVSSTAPDANSATTTVATHIVGDVQAPDGKHDFDFTSKSEDTWKLVDGKWLETKSKTTRLLVKVDGNVVQDQGQ